MQEILSCYVLKGEGRYVTDDGTDDKVDNAIPFFHPKDAMGYQKEVGLVGFRPVRIRITEEEIN